MPRRRIVRPDAPQVVDVLAQPETPAPAPVEPTPPPAEPVFAPMSAAGRPLPDDALTPEQLRIRQLEDALAKERGRKDPQPELELAPEDGDNIVIHFLEDGFTALGQVWYRGQELEFAPDGGAFADTRDRNGDSWLDLRHDEFAQVERWGKVMFRPGPWPGKDYTDATSFEPLQPVGKHGTAPAVPSLDELAAAARAERNRRRAVPRIPAA